MCRCLGGCSHAMSNNEERAWESWEMDMTLQLAVIRAACDAVEASARHSQDNAAAFIGACNRIDEASEALWQMRDGPEFP